MLGAKAHIRCAGLLVGATFSAGVDLPTVQQAEQPEHPIDPSWGRCCPSES